MRPTRLGSWLSAYVTVWVALSMADPVHAGEPELRGVSPGSARRATTSATPCPTFSFAYGGSAEGLLLEVFPTSRGSTDVAVLPAR